MGLILDSSREDLIVAATALQRRWAVATFNARECRHVRGLEVVGP